ncbi:MAG: sulfotransferase, partial [Geodermatophilaceae bacterium]|nr:sulfotransferase [Geodermatophilaceae bacterium]
PKEPHYFALHGQTVDFQGPGDVDTVNRVSVTDRDAYLRLFPAEHDFLALGDGSVSTLYYSERAVPEIVAVNPDMRVVVILREPVDRAYSSFQYLKTRGFEPEEHFGAAVADEERRKAQNWHHLWHYTSMSYYAADLRRLQEGLGRDQVGVFFYDDLQSDYASTLRRVQTFLGLPPETEQDLDVPRVNVSGTPKLLLLQKAIQKATRNELLRRTVKGMTSYRLREKIRSSGLRPAAATAQERAQLEPLFAADLVELAVLVDGPVPRWLRDAGPVRG